MLPKKLRNNGFFWATFILTFIFTISLVWVIVKREAYISELKTQISNFIKLTNQQGFDIAYEKLEFSYIPFSRIMKAENVILYNKESPNDFSWNVGEFVLLNNVVNYKRISIILGKEQKLILFGQNLDIKTLKSNVILQKNENEIENIKFDFAGIDAHQLFSLDTLEFIINNEDQNDVFSSDTFEVINIKISDYVKMPLLRKIDRIFVSFNTVSSRREGETLNATLKHWKDNGYNTDITKIIIRWEPLLLVGKGDLYINNKELPDIKIKTTSKGLLEALELLNTENILDESGFFILKLMLENKSYKLKPEDKHDTCTSKIGVSNNRVLIDNVPIYELEKN